jgi:predicted dehydrogenase
MADNKKIRLGALNVGEYSMWGIWAKALSPQGPFGSALLNMEVTHCWDVNPQLAAEFADQYGCEVVEDYDGMLGKVDAIAFGGLYEVPWQHRLARPYVEAGVPTYLSRPFSYRLQDIDELLDLAAKNSTPIIATTVFEHFIQGAILKSRLPAIGVIKSVYGVCNSGEYPGHFHLPPLLLRVIGYDVDQVSLLTDDERDCSYLQQTLLFKGNDNQPPFLATLHASQNVPYAYLHVVGEKGSETIEMTRSPDSRETLYHFFAPQLLDMHKTFQGEQYQPLDAIRKKTQVFLAGYYSHLEKGGSFAALDNLPADWSPRHFKPGWIDESMFKRPAT